MKKKLLSLVLALLLVVGVAAVPSMSADAAGKKQKYTRIEFKNKAVPVTFVVKKADREKAANDLNKALGIVLKKDINLTINGRSFVATNENGTIYCENDKLGKKTLVEYVKAIDASKTSIQIKTNPVKFLKAVKVAGKANYKFTIKVGTAKFSNVKLYKNGKITFNGGTKFKQTGYISGKYLYIKKVNKKGTAKFFKNLKKAKVVKKSKIVKKAF